MGKKKEPAAKQYTRDEAEKSIQKAKDRITDALDICDGTSQEMNCRYGLDKANAAQESIEKKETVEFASLVKVCEEYADLAEAGIETAEEEKESGLKAEHR